MKIQTVSGLAALAVATLAPGLAAAHIGADGAHAILPGWLHPLSGLDHICAIVAAGVIAGRSAERAVWRIPLLFAVALVSGAGVGLSTGAISSLEPLVTASAVILALWALFVGKASARLVYPVLIGFAAIHGLPHGWEAPQGVGFAAYLAGIGLTTGGLASLAAILTRQVRVALARR